MNFNVASLLDGAFTDPIRVTRSRPGYHTHDLRYIEGEPFIIDCLASIQPVSGQERLMLDEADRTRESIKVYTAERLQTTGNNPPTSPDKFCWQGRNFVVKSVEYWPSYSRSVAVALDGSSTWNKP